MSENPIKFIVLPQQQQGEQTQFSVLPLANGSNALFVVTGSGLFQLQKFNSDLNSWAIGDYIVMDGTLMVATPYEPLFLLLPALVKQTERFTTLYDVLYAFDAEHTALLNLSNIKVDLAMVCDVLENDDEPLQPYCKLNEDKLMKWLKKKVDRLAVHLDSMEAFQDHKFQHQSTYH